MDTEISNPENYDVVYYSIDYRLSIQHADQTTTNYSDETLKTYFRKDLGESNTTACSFSKEKADEAIEKYRTAMTKEGDTILGESVHYVLQPQASFVLIDQSNGYVKAPERRPRAERSQPFLKPCDKHAPPAWIYFQGHHILRSGDRYMRSYPRKCLL